MKHFRYVILGVCFVFTSSVFSQTIIKVKNPYVLIDISENSGYQIKDQFLVYHPIEGEEDKLVGVVELMAFREDQCAAKIIKESVSTKIQEGDIVSPYQVANKEKMQKDKPTESSQKISSSTSPYHFQQKSQLPSYLFFTAGLISCGVSYYYYNEAEKTATTYHTSQEEHDSLVDEARKYDKISNFCLGLGGGLIAYSVVNYFLTRRANIKMSRRISVVPVHKRDFYGMGLSINLNSSE